TARDEHVAVGQQGGRVDITSGDEAAGLSPSPTLTRARVCRRGERRSSARGFRILFLPLGPRLRRHHNPKTEVIGSCLDFAFATRANDVARTVLVVAKKRTAAMDTLFH